MFQHEHPSQQIINSCDIRCQIFPTIFFSENIFGIIVQNKARISSLGNRAKSIIFKLKIFVAALISQIYVQYIVSGHISGLSRN